MPDPWRDDWWPDWRGETVVIAASGPSQRREDIDYARGRARVMAINSTWRLAPWADVLYGCDKLWWETCGPKPDEFAGLRVAGSTVEGCHKIGVKTVSNMIWTGVEIGGGGNSSFQAMNLAVMWGADRVILTGVDCKRPGEHWHGKHPSPLAQTKPEGMGQWIKCFNQVAPALKQGGVDVINCTRDTALECFRRAAIEDVL